MKRISASSWLHHAPRGTYIITYNNVDAWRARDVDSPQGDESHTCSYWSMTRGLAGSVAPHDVVIVKWPNIDRYQRLKTLQDNAFYRTINQRRMAYRET